MSRIERLRREPVIGLLAIVVGLGLALAVQVAAPVGVPLYDGVPVLEPYRFLHPTGNQVGDPTSFEATKAVEGSESPALLAATTENPPQAQLVAGLGAFVVPPGTTSVKVSVTPVDATVQPESGQIAGNVYRFAVTDESGGPLQPKTCDTCRTLVLRVPDEGLEAKIAHLEGGTWVDLQTLHAGVAAMLQINASALGDYALIAGSGSGGGGIGGADALIFGAVALGLFFAVVAGLFWYRRRPAPVPVAQLGPTRARVPSKRKGPRRPTNRPPGGRSSS